nr:MAG TPA: hypothetical protein [Caudoviricetes sp.]
MEFLILTNAVTEDYIKQIERIGMIIIPKSKIVKVSERTDYYKSDSCWESRITVLYNTGYEEYLVTETLDEIYDMLK